MIRSVEGLFDDGGWCTVDVKEKQGGAKRDAPGERWPSSFELTAVAFCADDGAAEADGVPALGSPVLPAGGADGPPVVEGEDLPF